MHRLMIDWQGPTDGSAAVRVIGSTLFCPGQCKTDFPAGSTVTLDFVAGGYGGVADYSLTSWQGACTPNGNSCTVTLDQDVTITPALLNTPHTVVQVYFTGAGGGSASANLPIAFPHEGDAPPSDGRVFQGYVLTPGQTLVLTPSPRAGSRTQAWRGPCAAAGAGACVITGGEQSAILGVNLEFQLEGTPRYALHQLPPGVEGFAVNSSGLIAGWQIGNADHSLFQPFAAVIYDYKTGTLTRLFDDGNQSAANAINSRGDVAGFFTADEQTPTFHVFLRRADGTITEAVDQATGAHIAVAEFGGVVALTDGGTILGNAIAHPADFQTTPFSFDGTRLTWLGNAGDRIVSASPSGDGLGCVMTSTGAQQPALFRAGQAPQIVAYASEGSTTCFAAANGSGLTIGYTTTWHDLTWQTLAWDGATFTRIPLWSPNAVNASGAVVGSLDLGGDYNRMGTEYFPATVPAIWSSGGPAQNLNALVSLDGRVLTSAIAINDAGMILGDVAIFGLPFTTGVGAVQDSFAASLLTPLP